MLDDLANVAVAAAVYPNPLATPPPDDSLLPASHIHDLALGLSSRPRLSLSFLDDIRLASAPNPHSAHSQHSAVALDSQTSGLSASSNFRFTARPPYDASAASAGGESTVYDSASAAASGFGPASGVATSAAATSVTGYPSSPPPSRQRSDNGHEREYKSGANRFVTQSPDSSPIDQQVATAQQTRLNISYSSSVNASSQDTYSLTQTEQQQRAANHQQQHPPSNNSTLQSPSDRFPPIDTMLAPNRYPRMDRYAVPHPMSERRMSEPSNHFPKQYSSMPVGSAYNSPSYQLHRVSRSGSFSDLESGVGMPTGSEWREDDAGRHGLGRGGRGNIDNYSPVASAFPASSMANSGLPSPHGLPQHSQGAHGYGNTAGGYALYGSPDDVSYNDGRPHSSSGESNSPAYGYSNLSSSANAGDLHAQHAAYAAATGVDPASKTYSFVSLPGNTVRKRPRRRYDEIERLYACNYPGCTKSYGTLNHLNAHVNMQKHGVKRHPNEFKEMRKQWRKMKKEQEHEREARRQSESYSALGSAGLNGVSGLGGPPGSNTLDGVMRRRRATDPTYGISVSPDGNNGNAVSHSGTSAPMADTLSMPSMDVSSYGMGTGLPMSVGIDSMGNVNALSTPTGNVANVGGYGHHHYAQPASYHGQSRPGLAPISPLTPSSPAFSRLQSNGSMATPLSIRNTNHSTNSNQYYNNIGQGQQVQGEQHPDLSTPPSLNRLPADSTLLTPLHSNPQHVNIGNEGYSSSSLPDLTSISRMEHHGQ